MIIDSYISIVINYRGNQMKKTSQNKQNSSNIEPQLFRISLTELQLTFLQKFLPSGFSFHLDMKRKGRKDKIYDSYLKKNMSNFPRTLPKLQGSCNEEKISPPISFKRHLPLCKPKLDKIDEVPSQGYEQSSKRTEDLNLFENKKQIIQIDSELSQTSRSSDQHEQHGQIQGGARHHTIIQKIMEKLTSDKKASQFLGKLSKWNNSAVINLNKKIKLCQYSSLDEFQNDLFSISSRISSSANHLAKKKLEVAFKKIYEEVKNQIISQQLLSKVQVLRSKIADKDNKMALDVGQKEEKESKACSEDNPITQIQKIKKILSNQKDKADLIVKTNKTNVIYSKKSGKMKLSQTSGKHNSHNPKPLVIQQTNKIANSKKKKITLTPLRQTQKNLTKPEETINLNKKFNTPVLNRMQKIISELTSKEQIQIFASIHFSVPNPIDLKQIDKAKLIPLEVELHKILKSHGKSTDYFYQPEEKQYVQSSFQVSDEQ